MTDITISISNETMVRLLIAVLSFIVGFIVCILVYSSNYKLVDKDKP
jgi:hypothetical protein